MRTLEGPSVTYAEFYPDSGNWGVTWDATGIPEKWIIWLERQILGEWVLQTVTLVPGEENFWNTGHAQTELLRVRFAAKIGSQAGTFGDYYYA